MKTIRFILVIIVGLYAGRQIAYAQSSNDGDFYYENIGNNNIVSSEEKTEIGKIIKKESVNNQGGLLYQIRGYFQLNKDTYSWEEPALEYAKMLINMVLSFVSLISLILVIVAFYLIFFWKWEEAVKKAKWILKGVAIAIGLIAISWIIVNSLFLFYTQEVIKGTTI